jgi:hypothetical protein
VRKFLAGQAYAFAMIGLGLFVCVPIVLVGSIARARGGSFNFALSWPTHFSGSGHAADILALVACISFAAVWLPLALWLGGKAGRKLGLRNPYDS